MIKFNLRKTFFFVVAFLHWNINLTKTKEKNIYGKWGSLSMSELHDLLLPILNKI